MTTLADVYNDFMNTLKSYPAVAAMLLNIAVVMTARFGFNVDPTQLAEFASFTAAFLGVVVHNSVTPMIALRAKHAAPPEVKEQHNVL